MSAKIIDGRAIAADLRVAVAGEVRRLMAAHGLQPGLAVVLVGENPASQTYVGSKSRALVEVGMRPFDFKLPVETSEEYTVLISLRQAIGVHGTSAGNPVIRRPALSG